LIKGPVHRVDYGTSLLVACVPGRCCLASPSSDREPARERATGKRGSCRNKGYAQISHKDHGTDGMDLSSVNDGSQQ
ncbi:hypothetical protein ACWEWL_32860, partial [Streptomyces rochei]